MGIGVQVFRRVTVPLLAPVLSVVFITMIINVLKVFDIVSLWHRTTQKAGVTTSRLAIRPRFRGVRPSASTPVARAKTMSKTLRTLMINP